MIFHTNIGMGTPKFPAFGVIFEAEFNNFVRENQRRLRKHMEDKVKNLLSGKSPSRPGRPPGRDTGKLVKGVYATIVQDASLRQSGRVKVGVRKYAWYGIAIDRGTGLYGPNRRKIVPRRKKALAFMWHGKLVITKSVRGIRPRPWRKYLPGIFRSFRPTGKGAKG